MNKDKEMDLLNGKKYNIITFGCQMNEHDSETIAGMLQEKGCVETMSRDDSDITIINTCSAKKTNRNVSTYPIIFRHILLTKPLT